MLAIGDSFLGPLTLFKRDAVRTLKFKGASARGLANPDSTTGANEQTMAALAEWDAFAGRPPVALLFFGNVDVHVNIFFKLSQDQVRCSSTTDDHLSCSLDSDADIRSVALSISSLPCPALALIVIFISSCNILSRTVL